MFVWQKSRIRHPFYPNLPVTNAAAASGHHAVLAGSFSELEERHREDASPAMMRERERLWSRFGVPSFVLLLDSRGRVEAFECEVQEGFHLPGKAAVDDGPLCPAAGLVRECLDCDTLPNNPVRCPCLIDFGHSVFYSGSTAPQADEKESATFTRALRSVPRRRLWRRPWA